MNYDDLRRASKTMNENNDCGPKAIAAVCGIPYEESHELFKKAGRKHGGSSTLGMLKTVLVELGRKCVKQSFEAKTVRTLERELPDFGRYLIFTDGHVLAALNGKIIDWTSGRLHRVQAVYEVFKSKRKSQ